MSRKGEEISNFPKNMTTMAMKAMVAPRVMRCGDVIKVLAVRLLLVLHNLFVVWRTVAVKENDQLWYLMTLNVLIVLETIVRIRVHNCQEGKWFTPVFLLFMVTTLPCVWILEFDRLERYDNILNKGNVSQQHQALSSVAGLSVPLRLEADTWLEILEQSFLFILIIGRWLLPRGKVTRHQLSHLLFIYIGIASDVMELFIVFDEPEIRHDEVVRIATLVVWSISLLQFCIVLTAVRKPNNRVFPAQRRHFEDSKRCSKFLETEIWSLLASMVLQDGSFLALRLYTIIVHNFFQRGIIFFAFKNFLVICMLFYRVFVVCFRDEDEEDDTGHGLDARG